MTRELQPAVWGRPLSCLSGFYPSLGHCIFSNSGIFLPQDLCTDSPSANNVLPTSLHMASSFRSQLICHLFSEVFLCTLSHCFPPSAYFPLLMCYIVSSLAYFVYFYLPTLEHQLCKDWDSCLFCLRHSRWSRLPNHDYVNRQLPGRMGPLL